MQENLPPELYKYTTAEAAKEILLTSSIRCSSPVCFNDPYDSSPPIELTKPLYIKGIRLEQLLNKSIELLNLYARIFCMSAVKDSILMWSHYADMHKGVVIEFDSSADKIKEAKEVIYGKSYTINVDEVKSRINNGLSMFFYKERDWKYEKEYRYVFLAKELNKTAEGYNKEKKTSYEKLLEDAKSIPTYEDCCIEKTAIKSVILGCNISEINEQSILEILRLKYPESKCYKAIKNEDSYKLSFGEIDIH